MLTIARTKLFEDVPAGKTLSPETYISGKLAEFLLTKEGLSCEFDTAIGSPTLFHERTVVQVPYSSVGSPRALQHQYEIFQGCAMHGKPRIPLQACSTRTTVFIQ